MKCQILFSKKNKKIVISLSSAESVCQVVNVKHQVFENQTVKPFVLKLLYN